MIAGFIPDVVRARARSHPDRRAYVFLDDHGAEVTTVTYGDLHDRAVKVAARLSRTCVPGDRALLLFGQSPGFVVSFLACLHAGVLAVPVAPPRRSGNNDTLLRVIADCEPAAVLTDAAMHAVAPMVEHLCGDISWIDVGVDVPTGDTVDERISHSFEDVAFLQYTSGSTSTPKGVMVTHGNLAANQEMIRRAFDHDENSTVVGWAPFFHDQGLIGNLLQPLYVGATAILMSPGAFIRRPLLWLTTIAKYRAHTSGGPNFAFEACVSRAPSTDLTGLDLSTWTVAFNGAEPIRPDTLQRFSETFGPFGFDPSAHFPCYGLAEATLLVSASGAGRGARTAIVDTAGLRLGRTEPPIGNAPSSKLVGSGTVVPATDVAIVDPVTHRTVSERTVGEIWVTGPQVAHGYWRKPDDTERDFHAIRHDDPHTRHLRTGDLGVLIDGELHVVGRSKDMLIIRGKNFYPHDIEHTSVCAHPSIRAAGCAAFSVDGDAGETLVVVAEVGLDTTSDAAPDIAAAIRGAVTMAHQLAPSDVVLTVAGALDKTTSGKIRRSEARQRYLQGAFPAIPASPAAVA